MMVMMYRGVQVIMIERDTLLREYVEGTLDKNKIYVNLADNWAISGKDWLVFALLKDRDFILLPIKQRVSIEIMYKKELDKIKGERNVTLDELKRQTTSTLDDLLSEIKKEPL